jgi:hypothetical protein
MPASDYATDTITGEEILDTTVRFDSFGMFARVVKYEMPLYGGDAHKTVLMLEVRPMNVQESSDFVPSDDDVEWGSAAFLSYEEDSELGETAYINTAFKTEFVHPDMDVHFEERDYEDYKELIADQNLKYGGEALRSQED